MFADSTSCTTHQPTTYAETDFFSFSFSASKALPDNNTPWWKEKHLLRLNALLFLCCMSAATVGYDGEYNLPSQSCVGAA